MSVMSGTLPDIFSKLMFSPSTEESIIFNPNNNTPFGKVPPLKLQQSTTNHVRNDHFDHDHDQDVQTPCTPATPVTPATPIQNNTIIVESATIKMIVPERDIDTNTNTNTNKTSATTTANTINFHLQAIHDTIQNGSTLTIPSVGSPDCYDSLDEIGDDDSIQELSNTQRSSLSNLTLPDDDNKAQLTETPNDSIPMCQLLAALTGVQEEVLLKQEGYCKIKKLYNILQGEIIEAKITSDHPLYNSKVLDIAIPLDANIPTIKKRNISGTDQSVNYLVTIKKCDKVLVAEHISYADDEDMHFCVDDSILKERDILQYLTIDNIPTCDYIARYIDFFQSEEDYYLVTESIRSGITLQAFIEKAHQFIKIGKLKCKEYQKIIKYIFWQLCAVMHWLHDDMHCMFFI